MANATPAQAMHQHHEYSLALKRLLQKSKSQKLSAEQFAEELAKIPRPPEPRPPRRS